MPEYPHAELTERMIGSAIEVHRHLGPGLLESVYEACLCRELTDRGVVYERQAELPVRYKGAQLDIGYRIDVLVENIVVVELKAVEELTSVHEAQLMTYLKLAKRPVGLLINFNIDLLKNDILRRVV